MPLHLRNTLTGGHNFGLTSGLIIDSQAFERQSEKDKRTKAVVPVARADNVAVFLSGTPARPLDRRTLQPNLGTTLLYAPHVPDWDSYATRYCDAKQGRFVLECSGASNLEGVVAVRHDPRLKSEVLAQLPAKRRQKVDIDIPYSRVKDIKKKLKQRAKLMSVLDDKAYPEAESLVFAQQCNHDLLNRHLQTKGALQGKCSNNNSTIL